MSTSFFFISVFGWCNYPTLPYSTPLYLMHVTDLYIHEGFIYTTIKRLICLPISTLITLTTFHSTQRNEGNAFHFCSRIPTNPPWDWCR